MQLNVRSVFTTAQRGAARKILRAGTQGGAIINMSSQMGHVGAVRRSAYCMTKHAVEGMTKAMALELAEYRIRVNTIAPTFVETPMTRTFFEDRGFRDWVMQRLPLGRLLPAEDVAASGLLSGVASGRDDYRHESGDRRRVDCAMMPHVNPAALERERALHTPGTASLADSARDDHAAVPQSVK